MRLKSFLTAALVEIFFQVGSHLQDSYLSKYYQIFFINNFNKLDILIFWEGLKSVLFTLLVFPNCIYPSNPI